LNLLCAELAFLGRSINRQLSLHGIEFETFPVTPSAQHIAMHDALAKVWQQLMVLPVANTKAASKNVFGAGLRLFKCLALTGKVDQVVELVKHHLGLGHQVVISLISTGEAASTRIATDSTDAPSDAEASLFDMLNQVFDLLEDAAEETNDGVSLQRIEAMREASRSLVLYPASPLDLLKHKLGGAAAVAELTGRSSYVEYVPVRRPRPVHTTPSVSVGVDSSDDSDAETQEAEEPPAIGAVEAAAESEQTDYHWRVRPRVQTKEGVTIERAAFQAAKKKIAILSTACDTGTSLHADGPGAARRVQILFELPWSSSRALQQLGRTHRAGQSSAPLYLLIGANGPEKRFVATVSARLSSMGALCSADRSHSAFQLEVEADRVSSDQLLGDTSGVARRDFLIQLEAAARTAASAAAKLETANNLPTDMRNDAIMYSALVKTKAASAESAKQLLNRLLCLPYKISNAAFERYVDVLEVLIQRAVAAGGSVNESALELDLRLPRFEQLPSVDLSGECGQERFCVRIVKETRVLSFDEAVAMRNTLLARGAKPEHVYFASGSGPELIHLRTATTARRYRPQSRIPVTFARRHAPHPEPMPAQLRGVWETEVAAHRDGSRVTHAIAALPALWLTNSLDKSKIRLLKLTEADGSRRLAVSVSPSWVETRARRRDARIARETIAAREAAAVAAVAVATPVVVRAVTVGEKRPLGV
jgi:hypothetical protein